MAQGLSNSAIAERLVLAPVSIEKHIGNLLSPNSTCPSAVTLTAAFKPS
ncbi:hypothetical protein [Streptomyces sp. NPDC005244]